MRNSVSSSREGHAAVCLPVIAFKNRVTIENPAKFKVCAVIRFLLL